MGMEIGDYDFLDSILHCPAANWVEQGMVLEKLKN